MENKILTEFHRMLTSESVNDNFKDENGIKSSFRDILYRMSVSYEECRKYSPKLLTILEFNKSNSISHSINLFFELYDQLIDSKEFQSFDLSTLKYDPDDQTLEKIKTICEAIFSEDDQLRISESKFDISALSIEDKNKMAILLIRKLQIDSSQPIWSNAIVKPTMLEVILLHHLLVALSNEELFYHAISIYYDRLSTSEYNQGGRDISEELIISSYKDGVPELGYFNSFKLNSKSSNIHASLLYANLSMVCMLQKQQPYSEKYVKEIIWQGMKFFREVGFVIFSKRIYDAMPGKLKYNDSDRRSVDHANFLNLMIMEDPLLPSKLFDYFNKEREQILSGGIQEALPWLNTLYYIRKNYPQADFSSTGLGFYLNAFELIVPPETSKKNRDFVDGTFADL